MQTGYFPQPQPYAGMPGYGMPLPEHQGQASYFPIPGPTFPEARPYNQYPQFPNPPVGYHQPPPPFAPRQGPPRAAVFPPYGQEQTRFVGGLNPGIQPMSPPPAPPRMAFSRSRGTDNQDRPNFQGRPQSNSPPAPHINRPQVFPEANWISATGQPEYPPNPSNSPPSSPESDNTSLYSTAYALSPTARVIVNGRGTNLNGKKKALVIGIQYTGKANLCLDGCWADVRMATTFLENNGFKSDDICVMTDEPHVSRLSNLFPTRDNIIQQMRNLVKGAEEGDSFFVHYSGHGGQVDDYDGDELDGRDETLWPVDGKEKAITDDTLFDILVKPLPQGCQLTGVFDCCSSGTILDLPNVYDSKGNLKSKLGAWWGRRYRFAKADVTCWSSCKDGTEARDLGQGGVMSNEFYRTLRHYPNPILTDLLNMVRLAMKQQGVAQKAQFSSSQEIDPRTKEFRL